MSTPLDPDSLDLHSSSTCDPQIAILSNSAALNSLKRQQLIKLCKLFSLSAKGKNTELVERLQGKGKQLATTVEGVEESWSLIGGDLVPTEESLEEFGLVQRATQGSMSSSGSQGSLASTIRSAGNKLRNTFSNHSTSANSNSTTTTTRPTIESIYPSLTHEIAQLDHDEEKTLEFDHSVEGGIRLVPTRTSYAPSLSIHHDDNAPLPPPMPMTSTPAPPTSIRNPFVFGSPIPSNSPFEFSIMPGSLLSLSTTSNSTNVSITEKDEKEKRSGKTASELIVEEMNRRALETRLKAEREGVRLGVSEGGNGSGKRKEEGGMFGERHKRVFEAMDSITNHYAAKRPLPSSSNLAQLAPTSRNSPKKPLPTSTSNSTLNQLDRPVKRIKPSASSAQLVSALKEEGWTSTSNTKKSDQKLGSSIASRGTMGSMSLSDNVRERQMEREKERDERKRKLELAKARRKSGATPIKKRGRSMEGTAAKPPIPSNSTSTASQFLKSTFRKLTHPTSTSTASHLPAPLPASSSISQIPRFASSTASSSNRAGLVSAHSSRSIVPLRASPKKEPGWKKFDLQESLRRGMSWKNSLGSSSGGKAPLLAPTPTLTSTSNPTLAKPPSFPQSNSSLTRQTSTSSRATNPSLLTTATSRLPLPTSHSSQSNQSKLASLPPAPKTPFTPLTNSSVPPIGKKVEKGEKKVVSSVSKKSRGLKGSNERIEGLESRARKIRARGKGEGK